MIGQTGRGIDYARASRDGWARYIADQALRGEVPTYALDAYRDASTDLRDMYAMVDDKLALRQGGAS